MTKNTPAVFPYRKDVAGNAFPVIPLTMIWRGKKKEFLALVDSGATISIFGAETAEELGLKIEKGEEVYLGGIGGRIKGYIHKIKIEAAGRKFACPIVFSREYLVSFNLIGRQDFFRNFRIIFEEKKNYLKLE